MWEAIKNGNAILFLLYWLIALVSGVFIQHFRGTNWSFWFWLFYLLLWAIVPIVLLIVILSITLAVEDKKLRESER